MGTNENDEQGLGEEKVDLKGIASNLGKILYELSRE